ncbi:MAG TPA: metallophosphoesterase [Bacteroidia bacterium]|mgnify:CR=1 FL=1|nr:metallophosphoesterase [Bacteroidia bacterium]MBP7714224.1 metallophosphoesterase [Bacteroidia bacterium]HOZ90027.1 metallophosphoesterase [Bacteroidia bacterium]HQW18847.1 metallophosphoesterase [Bacteroidia bacterium]HQW49668.1 metallophosphoesterase [Bacteroidia bacterium]
MTTKQFLLAFLFCLPLFSKADTTLVSFNDAWKYFDNGYLPATNWNQIMYNDSAWAIGNGEFGYGDGDETTVVSYGGDPNNKFVTTYFRKTISLNNPYDFASYHLDLKRDDGAIVYINGTEVFRSNMTSGSVGFNTPAYSDCVDDGMALQSIVLVPADFLAGVNVIAVEVHQINNVSSDLSFDLQLNAYNNFVPQLLRQPYLQMVADSAITIRWRTNVSCQTAVLYGNDPDSLNFSVSDSANVIDHEIRLTGLSPDTRYFYALGDGTNVLQGDSNNYFKTAPVKGMPKPVRIWSMGDTGINTIDQNNVRDAFLNYNDSLPIDLLYMLGDNAYYSGTDQEYQDAFFQNHYEDILKNIPVFSVAGNHENYTANAITQTGPYYDIFTFPKNGECGGVPSGSEAYYSFDYSNIHFIALETNTLSLLQPGSDMLNWLQSDIAATQQKWKIVVFHNSPYTKGGHNSDTETDLILIRQNIMPILDQHKVDLVLCGHNHVYERSYFMDGHYGLSSTFDSTMVVDSSFGELPQPYLKKSSKNYKGLVVVQAGCSGVLDPIGPQWPHPAMKRYYDQELGSLLIEIETDTLTVTFVDNNVSSPQVLDEFSVVKECNVVPQLTVPVAKVCVTDDPVQLSATPIGGFFSGLGVVDTVFNPTVAGQGIHTIAYTYNDIYGCHVTDTKTIEVVGGVPSQPFGIVGSILVCPPSNNEVLSIQSLPDADSYIWSASAGVNLTSSNTDTLIKFDINTVLPQYNISVSALNICGSSIPSLVNITSVKSFPVSLTGNSVICPGDTSVYTVNVFNSLSSYWWQPSEHVFLNGQSDIINTFNTLHVNASVDSSFTEGKICVASKEACLRNNAVSFIDLSTKPPVPGVISGPAAVLGGSNGVVYSIVPVSGATGYFWTVTGDAILTAGQFGNSVTVDFLPSFTGGYVGVKSQSNCDESIEVSKRIKTYIIQVSQNTVSQTRIANEYNQDKIVSVYPNPIGNEMHVKLLLQDASSNVLVVLKDVAGKEVGKWSKKVFSDEDDITLNVSGLSSGVYFLCVTTDNMQWNGVVVKQNDH